MQKTEGRKRAGRRSLEEIQRIVSEYEASGLSRDAFAESRGIGRSTLDNWRQRVRKAALVPVTLKEPSKKDTLELVVGDHVVRVPPGFDEESLRRLVRLLTE